MSRTCGFESLVVLSLLGGPIGCDGSRISGALPGLQARCDDACAAPMECQDVRGARVCTRTCDGPGCVPEGTCWLAEGVCVRPYGRVADACETDDDCHPGLTCLRLEGPGFCGKTCGPTEGCPAEGDNVCVRMEPASYGTWCLRRCATADDCGDGLGCREMAVAADYGVCFP